MHDLCITIGMVVDGRSRRDRYGIQKDVEEIEAGSGTLLAGVSPRAWDKAVHEGVVREGFTEVEQEVRVKGGSNGGIHGEPASGGGLCCDEQGSAPGARLEGV
jgi:hypothetical protein